MLWLVPLLLAAVLAVPVAAAPFVREADLLVSRVALGLFGTHVANDGYRREFQRDRMQAAHVGETHRVYAARTLLFATVAGVLGSVLGVYLGAGLVLTLRLSTEAMLAALPPQLAFLANLTQVSQLRLTQLFGLFVVSSATLGAGAGFGTYWARWQFLDSKANARATGIDATLPRTVAFVYALSRSGMPFPKILRTLERNRGVYGEAANEVSVAVRDMDTFNTDVLTSLQRMAERTPSEGFEEFSENLVSVLGSGRNLPEFLHEQYERYREEAEALQQQYLDLLSTFAEIYVTVLVAGPLFFITVLVVIGLVLSDTLTLIRVVAYLGVPLASFAFIVYIDSMTQPLRQTVSTPDDADTDRTESQSAVRTAADGGRIAESATGRQNRERLDAYDALAPFRNWIDRPLDTLLARPGATLVVSLPVAAAWALVRAAPLPHPTDMAARFTSGVAAPEAALQGEFVRSIDGPLVEATIVVLLVYALVHEIQKRRTRAVEERVPDFLDRLAGVNEAGMTVTESLSRVRGGELGRLGPEIDRIWRDVQWGADARTALRRMERRNGAVLLSQSVALITNAMRASGDIAPVLRIAADEAQENRRLRRERRQEMFTYLLVIYISFLVFIGIITALSVAFVPAINQASGAVGTGGATGGVTAGLPGSTFGGLGGVDTEAYSVLFFHIAAIQAVCSGLIAGLLGEGTLRDGVKHATILLTLAYAVAVFLL